MADASEYNGGHTDETIEIPPKDLPPEQQHQSEDEAGLIIVIQKEDIPDEATETDIVVSVPTDSRSVPVLSEIRLGTSPDVLQVDIEQVQPEEVLRITASSLQDDQGGQSVAIHPSDLPTDQLEIIEIGSLPAEPPLVSMELIPESSTLTILAHEIAAPQPQYVISPEDLIKPTVIQEPLDGRQVGLGLLEVQGQAEPDSQLMLEVGGFQAETQAGEDGTFLFQDVHLHDGWNEIRVRSLSYPGFVRCQTAIQVYRQERPLLFIGLRDPYSQSRMTADDEVVRCRRCGTFARLDSWQALPGCAAWGCQSRQYWTPDDPQFYEEEEEVTLVNP